MIRSFIIILSVFIVTGSVAQTGVLRKYFDSSWVPAAKESAFYYADFTPQQNIYQVVTYYAASGNLHGKSSFADTLFKQGIGLRLSYYETGELKDSGFFYAKGGYLTNQFTFKKNGKPDTHIYTNYNSNIIRIEAYDDNGKIDPKATIILIPAVFDGGIPAWQEYLQKHLKTNIPVKNKAPVGIYDVVVSFVIGTDGRTTEVTADNDPGYGTREEAIRVIQNSPKWKPATKNGEPVIYRHRQSIKFQVTEK